MANEIAGFKGVLLLSTSTGGTKTDIASLRNFSIDHSLSTVDVTTHESSGARVLIAGVTQWSGSAETLHVTSNATHEREPPRAPIDARGDGGGVRRAERAVRPAVGSEVPDATFP